MLVSESYILVSESSFFGFWIDLFWFLHRYELGFWIAHFGFWIAHFGFWILYFGFWIAFFLVSESHFFGFWSGRRPVVSVFAKVSQAPLACSLSFIIRRSIKVLLSFGVQFALACGPCQFIHVKLQSLTAGCWKPRLSEYCRVPFLMAAPQLVEPPADSNIKDIERSQDSVDKNKETKVKRQHMTCHDLSC